MSSFTASASPVPPGSSPPGSSPKLEKFKQVLLQAAKDYHDPWEKYGIDKIPAERVRRHRYLPETGKWVVDESIVKIERAPFDHGSMRSVYRMKKISQVQLTAWNKVAWKNAPNYVAKRYKADAETGAEVSRDHYFEDIQLQYEASKWADLYNTENPPKRIKVIQCYVIEFFERPGSPIFGCERFVDGHDKLGEGFVKHNSNSGFVEAGEARMTPQTFSAYSFYKSNGTRMVVDVQGVGDLYTDPQVHSIDCRFGDGDLGHRGMALFFGTFYRNSLCDFFRLPIFELSKKEKARLRAPKTAAVRGEDGRLEEEETESRLRQMRRLSRRQSWLAEKFRSSRSFSSLTPEKQLASLRSPSKANLDEMGGSAESEEMTFELPPEEREEVLNALQECEGHALEEIAALTAAGPGCKVNEVMNRSELDLNVALIHFELAMLEASGRFSDDVFDPVPDLSSCVFQLCQASMQGHAAASLALGRLRNGLSTAVITVLDVVVPQGADSAKLLLQLAALRGSLSGACLAAQLFESSTGDKDKNMAIAMYRTALALLEEKELEVVERSRHQSCSSVTMDFSIGDDVEVNYYGCGSWYPAKISDILQDPIRYVVNYEDGSIVEEADANNIRRLAGQERDTATQPGSIVAAVGDFDSPSPADADAAKTEVPYFVNSDETASIMTRAEILGSLGSLLWERETSKPTTLAEERSSVLREISDMLNEASSLAMDDGKAKVAMKYLELANQAAAVM